MKAVFQDQFQEESSNVQQKWQFRSPPRSTLRTIGCGQHADEKLDQLSKMLTVVFKWQAAASRLSSARFVSVTTNLIPYSEINQEINVLRTIVKRTEFLPHLCNQGWSLQTSGKKINRPPLQVSLKIHYAVNRRNFKLHKLVHELHSLYYHALLVIAKRTLSFFIRIFTTCRVPLLVRYFHQIE